jgi:hypothetical protein
MKEFDLNKHLTRQIKFSKKTFGPATRGKGKGVIDHIHEELEEIETSEYADLEEWTDVIILALDGAWRCAARAYPNEKEDALAGMVTSMLDFKQRKNEKRDWPDWRTQDPDKAIGHIKESEMPDQSALGRLLTADPSELVHYPPYGDDSKSYDVI